MPIRKTALKLFSASLAAAMTANPLFAQVPPQPPAAKPAANPAHEELKRQADAAYAKGDFQNTAALADKVLAENPKDDVAYYLRASARIEIGLRKRDVNSVRAGIGDAREAITLNGKEHVDYYLPYLYGMIGLSQLENKPEHADVAVKYATQILAMPELKNSEKANILLQRARAHAASEKMEESIADYEAALKENPNNLGVLLETARMLIANDKADKGNTYLDQAVKAFPNDPRPFNERGTLLQREGKLDEALADFNRVVTLDKDAHYGYMNRGFTYLEKGQAAVAEQDFERAMSLRPNMPSLYSLRGTARLMQSKLQDAGNDYRMAVELDPKNPIARGDLAFVQFFSGDYRGAAGSFDTALKANERLKHLTPWLYWSKLLSGAGTEAEAVAGKLTAPAADWDWSDRLLGVISGKMTGEEILASIKVEDPRVKSAQMCEAHFFIGQRALKAGDRDTGIKHLQQSIATGAKHLSAYRGSEYMLKRMNVALSTDGSIR